MYRITLLLAVVATAVGCAPEANDASIAENTVSTSTTAVTIPATTSVPEAPTTTVVPTTATTSTVSTTTSASVETTTTATLPGVETLDAGLFCRDVEALGYSYVDAVAYWVREGSPDRMDADRNGIPCETVYPADDVIGFWGDPLPTTTTTTFDVWYSVGNPEYRVDSLPGAAGQYGSGCSPGSDTLPDGIWFGRITEGRPTEVVFDLMCFGPGPEGPGAITNSSSKLRSVTIDPAAVVYAVAPDGGWELQAYPNWRLDPGESGFCPPEGCWDVWLYVNGGVVTEIVQLWFA